MEMVVRILLRAVCVITAALVLAYGFWRTPTDPSDKWLEGCAIAFVLLLVAFWPAIPRGTGPFERSLVRVGIVFCVAFLLLSFQLARLQVVSSASYYNKQGTAADGTLVMNLRSSLQLSKVMRGRIISADGKVIVGSQPLPGGGWERTYGDPNATYLAGYYSPQMYGLSNLEEAYNQYLIGAKGDTAFNQWKRGVLEDTERGYDLTLTLNEGLQDKASQLLGNRAGAVIVMNAKTGAILAMASSPHEDPSKLATSSSELTNAQEQQISAYWNSLLKSKDSPLLMRATQGLYVPGSIFKTITASAALETDQATPDSVYRDEGSLDVDGNIIPGDNRPNPNRVAYSLSDAYAYSLNVVFAQVGLALGPTRLEDYAKHFGIGEKIPFDLPTAVGSLYTTPNYLTNQAALADTSFGQGQLLVSPLQMALVADAVANGGNMMTPYLVQKVSTYAGRTLQTFGPDVWQQAIASETAAQMKQMMINSVEHGWANPATIPGFVVGGKTGTAETGSGNPHAWFIGFAGQSDPQYVVAVLVEHGGEGVDVALPIGRQMLQAALALPQQ